ncbi:hypothetical protein BJ170DRAFT_682921 [Xylariales sp. AK1849]|nr:hypothetical protein BJ170DRAFT_682921 [Xylariales sp. AK1849]
MDFIDDGSSDLGALWQQALEDYAKESGADLRAATQMRWDTTTILKDQEQAVMSFTSWRHNQGKVDKIRKTFARNAEIIQGIAVHIATAASAAFPPASAILTAFTYVMNAAKGVSDDYDIIESFFDIMNGFLERLSLLESKLPPEKVYQGLLMRVFTAILNLLGIARGYRKSGRFSKWAKSLVEHQDPKLKGAYDLLQRHLSRLESMTLMATLKQTLVISKDVTTLGTTVTVLGNKMEMGMTLTKQNIAISKQNLNLGLDTKVHAELAAVAATAGKELSEEALAAIREQQQEFKDFAKLFQQQQQKEARKGGPASDHHDSGAKKAAAMASLRRNLDCQQYLNAFYEQESDYKAAFVKGTFEWIEDEQAYRDFIDNKKRLLWIAGEPGMGKSTLTSVCHYFIREDYEHRSIGYILRACALQVALRDPKYRDHLLSDVQRQDREDEPSVKEFYRLFISKYPKDSGRKVIIILDGVDELSEGDFDSAKEMISMVSKSEANIQLIFTSDQAHIAEHGDVQMARLDLVKDRIRKDMWKIALARTKSMSRLRKLRPEVRRKIATRLRRKADNLRYIEHMARKLNALGAREGPILKELDRLPENTRKLYEVLLEECQRHRTPEEMAVLRVLFSWLAYSKRQVSLGEANKLVQIIATDSAISIDEELDGKSSRLLRLANSSAFEEQGSEASDIEAEDHEEDKDEETEAGEDFSVLLGFQERSLRAYFRDSDPDKNGLRSSASKAHKMIFETICRIFMTLKDYPAIQSEKDMLEYSARFWKDHLAAIRIEDLSNEEVKSVIEGLYVILDNKNNSMKKIQALCVPDSATPSIFGHTEERSEATLKVIQKWADRAIHIPSTGGQFSTIQEWFRPLVQNPYRIYIGNARSHISNWFQTSEWIDSAARSFKYAHEALRKGHVKALPELKQNTQLREHFEKFVLKPAWQTEAFDEDAILTVASAFWDVPKSYRAYWSIAMAMKFESLYVPALEQSKLGLELATDDSERFMLSNDMGQTLLQLAEAEEDNLKEKAYLDEACETFAKAIVITNVGTITARDHPLTRINCADLYMDYALAEFLRGDDDKMSILLSGAVKIPDVRLNASGLLDPIASKQSWPAALSALKLFKKVDRTWYLNYTSKSVHISLQKAAVELGQQNYIISMYSEAVRFLEQGRFGGSLRLYWADYHSLVRGELPRAKDILYGLVEYATVVGSDAYRMPSVSVVIWRIVDILVEEFRNTTDPGIKTGALDELKSILLRLKDTIGEDFDSSQSQTAIPLALMTRKLGLTVQFQEMLHTSFIGCINALSDNAGWNDSESFRTRAKVLSCIEGLEKEAGIAASCQLYVVDMDIHIRDTNPSPELTNDPEQVQEHSNADASETTGESAETANKSPTEATESTTGPAESSSDATADTPATSDAPSEIAPDTKTKTPPPSSVNGDGPEAIEEAKTEPASSSEKPNTEHALEEHEVPESDEDINSVWGPLYCNECEKNINSWKVDSAYLCLYCTDMDLCGECYGKRIAREEGRLPPAWRTTCPKGHKHVKAPIAGWAGVKNGIITIGEEKIVFTKWLKELKDVKWPNAWKTFWAQEMA